MPVTNAFQLGRGARPPVTERKPQNYRTANGNDRQTYIPIDSRKYAFQKKTQTTVDKTYIWQNQDVFKTRERRYVSYNVRPAVFRLRFGVEIFISDILAIF